MADTTTRIGTNVVGVEALQHSLRVTPDSSSITAWVPITEPMNPDLAFRSGHQGVMVGERAAAV
jgi:hypothetical protein